MTAQKAEPGKGRQVTEYARFRKLELNELVSIELPVHVWCWFMSEYAAQERRSDGCDQVSAAVQEALLDPLYVNEQLAARQQVADERHALMHRLVTGHDPDSGFPPTPESLEG